MNISLTCEISLSKKMRAIIGDNKARVVLNVNHVYAGIGCGTLTISTDDDGKIVIPEDFLNKETSIMIMPREIDDEISNVGSPIMSIFSDKDVRPSTSQYAQKTAVDRMAVRTAPEKEGIRHAVKSQEEIVEETPQELKVETNVQNYISNLSELLESINKAKSKVAVMDVDIDSITDIRKKAIAIEQKEFMEAIDVDAWVVNVKYASMTINDLGIQLPLNIPFNLNRISAKRLATSRDIQNYIKNGDVKIISPEEAVEYSNIHVETINSGLDVYDSADDAEDNAFRSSKKSDENGQSQKSTRRMMSVDELDEPTEEERLINTTKVGSALPVGGMTLSGGVRKTSHSSGGEGIRRSIPQTSSQKGDGFKTIAKK